MNQAALTAARWILATCLNLCEARTSNSQDLMTVTPPQKSATASYVEGIGAVPEAVDRVRVLRGLFWL